MKNLQSTAQAKETKSAIAFLIATIIATIFAGVATAAVLYNLVLTFQS